MKINLLECGPRDGWQNLKQMLPIEEKKHIIDGLVDAGVTMLEATSFVSPKAIPQMADAAELAQYVLAATRTSPPMRWCPTIAAYRMPGPPGCGT